VVSLSRPYQRREEGHAGAREPGFDLREDLVLGLRGYREAAIDAVGDAELGEKEAEVVVDLGHGRDRRFPAAAREPLFDGDRGRHARHQIHFGLVEDLDVLARESRKTLEKAPLPLGEDDVEGEARFSRAREAGQHHDAVAGMSTSTRFRLCWRAPRMRMVFSSGEP
jgi:hypothetical protein